MRRYELVTVVTDGHRIEGRRGVVLAFFGNILAFFGNKWAIFSFSRVSQMVTAVTDGPRWSQVVTVGHRIGEGWVRPLTEPPGVRCSTPRLDIYYVFDPDIFDERCVPCSAAVAPDWAPPCGPVSQIPTQGHNP